MVLGRGYVNAASVKLDDRLRVYSREEEKFVEFKVGKIEFEMKTGFVAPLTHEGTILVNDIDSSCYAEVNDHYMADLAMTPVKMWFRLKKTWRNYFKEEEEENMEVRSMNVDVSAYSSVLHKVASLFFASYLA